MGDNAVVRYDVSPLEVEWKNCVEYPHGERGRGQRKWVLDTATKIGERDLEGEEVVGRHAGLEFSRTRGDLQRLLVKGCRRHCGRAAVDHPELEKELNDYISGADPTVGVRGLLFDVAHMMSGRCIFFCRVRSPLSTGSPGPAPPLPVMGIGPSRTAVGDRVISFQPPESGPQGAGGGHDRSWGSWGLVRIWDHTYVVREQSALQLTESEVPQHLALALADQIPGSLPGLVGSRLVGDCFLLRERLGSRANLKPGMFGVQVSRAKMQLWT